MRFFYWFQTVLYMTMFEETRFCDLHERMIKHDLLIIQLYYYPASSDFDQNNLIHSH